MNSIKKNLILKGKNLLAALKALNNMSIEDALTLFVVDENRKIIGTLTDGDIRRSLINGASLFDKVENVSYKSFVYIKKTSYKVSDLQLFKAEGRTLIPILDDNDIIIDVLNLNTQKSLLPIDAVLMAGGKGVRLRPLTEKTPKPLLPVGGKPIIDYNVESLINYGIDHIFVTINYLKEQLKDHFKNPINNIKISTISEPKFLGTIGATQFVPKFYNDVVLVMNSDLFTNIDFEDFYLHFIQNNADISVAAIPYSISVPYGIFDLDGRKIKGVKEKPVYNYFANAGIYLIKREILENMPKGIFYNATDLIEDCVKSGKNVIRYPITGYWLDIGNHQEYAKAIELVKHIKRI